MSGPVATLPRMSAGEFESPLSTDKVLGSLDTSHNTLCDLLHRSSQAAAVGQQYQLD